MQDPKHDEPGHIQHYEGAAAIEKLKELAENARICMFTTHTKTFPMPSRPMALQTVEEDGTMQFFSAKSSDKNMEIVQDSEVQLFFGNSGDNEYLSVYGKASISTDRAKIKDLWNPIAKVWFQDGADDPDLTLISVMPIETKYWDTKHNKLVVMLKMGAAIVTGKTMDDGVEGQLEI